ncbi:class I SAM-dependent methyltransferase [Staphylococcus pseudintermedius]|uniref:class I SAM-dependent methyltransferase n=1 Tax=Staphylococcus pseudintermedius TaxID=283734 RepID=UPI0035C024AB
MIKKINENMFLRTKARSWFVEPNKRKISLEYDHRESKDIQKLSIETFLAYYKSLFNNYPKTILDIGCGQGESLEYLNKKGNHSRNLVGIDYSRESLEAAKNKGISAQFIEGDIEEMTLDTLATRRFDVIFIHLCFSLFMNPYDLISKLIQLMSNQSLIYIVDLNPEEIDNALETAKSPSEEKYLIDQYRASFSQNDMQLILKKVFEENNIKYHVGTHPLGGFSTEMLEFHNIISQQDFLENLPVFNPQSQKMIHFLNSWIIKTS